jgi:hypothetical protein
MVSIINAISSAAGLPLIPPAPPKQQLQLPPADVTALVPAGAPSSTNPQQLPRTAVGTKHDSNRNAFNRQQFVPASTNHNNNNNSSSTNYNSVPPPQRYDSSVICSHCYKPGHQQNNCYQFREREARRIATPAGQQSILNNISDQLSAQNGPSVRVEEPPSAASSSSSSSSSTNVACIGFTSDNGVYYPGKYLINTITPLLIHAVHAPPPAVLIKVKGHKKPFTCLIDSGAGLSCVHPRVAAQANLPVIAVTDNKYVKIQLADPTVQLSRIGYVEPEIKILFCQTDEHRPPISLQHRFEVLNIHYDFIIGRELIPFLFPNDEQNKYFMPPSVLARTPRMINIDIDLLPNTSPNTTPPPTTSDSRKKMNFIAPSIIFLN